MVKRLLLLLTVLALSLPGAAQSSGQGKVSSQLSHSKIGLDETATLTVKVLGFSDLVNISVPSSSPRGLRITQTGRSMSFSSVNGVSQSSTEFTYIVTPTEKGRFLINETEVTVNGIPYSTSSHRLEVTDAVGRVPRQAGSPWGIPGYQPGYPYSTQPQRRPAKDVLLEAELSPETVYEHQPTYYTVKLLSATRFSGTPHGNSVNPTGFLSVAYPQTTDTEVREGRQYAVAQVTKAFFPLTAGDYTFDPTELLIRSGFFGRSRTLRTEPKKVKVLPLPTEGQPESFTGAVGEEFTITAMLDRSRLRAGQSATLEVEVQGDGHLDLVPYPYLPNWPGVEKKQIDGDSKTEVKNNVLVSRRTYRFRLKMKEAGKLQLEDITLAYFRPSEERYEVVKVPPLAVDVAPGVAATDETSGLHSELPDKEKPLETEGSQKLQSTHLPLSELGLATGLGVLGVVLALFGGPVRPGSLGFGGKRRLGRPKNLEQLNLALRDLAPGSDSVQRESELQDKGWSSHGIERYERLRRQVASLQFGTPSTPHNTVNDLLKEYENLLKEARS